MSPAVLVTGGAGYIGSAACKAIARAGYLPVVYDNLSQGHRWAVKWGPLRAFDLADREALRATFETYKPVAVLHFAGVASVAESMERPELYYQNNVMNSLILLDCMLEAQVKTIVFSSSCTVYGLPQDWPIKEDHPQEPISPYGESKKSVERALHWYGQAHGLNWVALRYFNVAGADPEGDLGEDHSPETHLIPLAVESALGLRPHLNIYGTDYPTPDGTAIRDYVHVTDLADAHLCALDYLLRGGASRAFNLGTGQGHSVRQVISAAERAVGAQDIGRPAERRPGDPPALVADPSVANRTLEWRPRFAKLEEMVGTDLAWRLASGDRAVSG